MIRAIDGELVISERVSVAFTANDLERLDEVRAESGLCRVAFVRSLVLRSLVLSRQSRISRGAR